MVKQNYRKETEQSNKDTEKTQGNTHIPFSCPSETVSAPALNTGGEYSLTTQVMRKKASSIVQAIEILLRDLSKDTSSLSLYNK